jgi:hypothetical protein
MWAIDQVLGAAKAGVWDIVGDRDATILQDAESLYQYITTGKVPTANDGSE